MAKPPRKPTKPRLTKRSRADMERQYLYLRGVYTAKATTPREYEDACRRAAAAARV